MDVTFRKTGERRYGVWVERAEAPDVAMDPAPGFDPFLPHDLLPRGWEEHLAAAGVHRDRFEAVVAGLDELAQRWHRLEVGGGR